MGPKMPVTEGDFFRQPLHTVCIRLKGDPWGGLQRTLQRFSAALCCNATRGCSALSPRRSVVAPGAPHLGCDCWHSVSNQWSTWRCAACRFAG
ncbi:hypothetical protein R75483_06839 [Paraburkholderia domus]|nr:hypothetical protein R75483_06839 [Paraburkholderia domus]